MKRRMAVYATYLMLIAQGAVAGEDSTHRWHGVGPAWYEVEGGLRRFAAGEDDPVLGRKPVRKAPEKTPPTKPPPR
jgi:hypothetical protein